MSRSVFGFVMMLAACAGAVDDQPQLGQIEEAYTTDLEDGSGTYGIDMTPGLPYPRCVNNGSASQDCRFLKPYSPGDPFGGTPSRYKVNVQWGVGWASSNDASDARVNIRIMTDSMTLDLGRYGNGASVQSPTVIEYTDSASGSVDGINIRGGTLPGSNANYTDTFMLVTYNLCESNALSEPNAVAGSYRPCARADVTLDIAKLRAKYPDATQRAAKLSQLYAKAIVSGLGIGRQEVVQGYPSNRSFNTQEFNSTGTFFTHSEHCALQRVSTTSSGGLHDFLVYTGNDC